MTMENKFHSLLQQVLHDTYKNTHDIKVTKELFRTSIKTALDHTNDNDLDIKTILWLSETMSEIMNYEQTKQNKTQKQQPSSKPYGFNISGKFYCPIVRGISSSGLKYDKGGKYSKPLTGDIECLEPCLIVSIEKMFNNLIKVTFEHSNMVMTKTVDYYPISDDAIDKIFSGDSNAIVHELVNYYKSTI